MLVRWLGLFLCVGLGCGPQVAFESDSESGAGTGDGSGPTAGSDAGDAGGTDSDGSQGTIDAPSTCGDGFVDPGEACDSGGASDVCNEFCQRPGSLLNEIIVGGCGGQAVLGDALGNVVVLEHRCIGGTNTWSTQVTKLNSAGATQWSHQWEDPETQYASAQDLAVDPVGTVVYSGRARHALGSVSSDEYAWTRALDPNGALLWTNEDTEGPGSDRGAYGADIDAAGGIYIASHRTVSAVLRRLDADGTLLWTRETPLNDGYPNTTFVGAGPSSEAVLLFSRIQDNDRVTALQAYDALGDLLWESTINLSAGGRDVPKSIQVGTDGSIYVAGGFEDLESFRNTAFIAKLTGGGEVDWIWEHDVAGGAQDLAVDAEGNVFACIDVDEDPENEFVLILRLTESGDVQWSSMLVQEPPLGYHCHIGLTADENVVVTTTTADHETWLGWFAR